MKKLLLALALVLAALGAAEEGVQLEIAFAAPPFAEGPVRAALFSDEESFDEWEDPVRSVVLPLGADPLVWKPEALPELTLNTPAP